MSTGGSSTRRTRRRVAWTVAGVVLVLLLGAGVWVAWKGSVAYVGLRDAQDAAGKARAAIGRGDTPEATRQLEVMSSSLDRSREATADPVWSAASSVPWVGPNLRAVTTLSAALGDLVDEGVAPVVDAASLVTSGGLAPRDGRIDLAPIAAAAPGLAQAALAGERAAAELDGIDSGALLPVVAEQVDAARAQVREVASALRTGVRVAELLPPMLGADGERTYLALFLNSAELRATGGLVGALAEVTADDGVLTMSDTRAGTDLPRLDEPVLELTAEELDVHGEALGRIIQNVALTPDFPRTAELAAAMWEQDTGTRVDGVIATDVIALSHVLAGTGPVTTSDETRLTPETVVDELLHAPYLRFAKQSRADAFFADAAGRIFARLVSGGGEFAKVVDGLATATGEGRVLVWSRDSGEQDGLRVAGLSGAFLTGAAPAAGGIFLNDATGGKLDFFLDSALDVTRVTCTDDGGMDVVVRLRLASRVPVDQVEELPRYVTGLADVPAGSFVTRVTVYGPADGALRSTTRDGSAVGGSQGTEAGRDVNVLSLTLAPGESVAYEVEWHVDRAGRVEVWSTPTTTSPGRLTLPGSCAG